MKCTEICIGASYGFGIVRGPVREIGALSGPKGARTETGEDACLRMPLAGNRQTLPRLKTVPEGCGVGVGKGQNERGKIGEGHETGYDGM